MCKIFPNQNFKTVASPPSDTGVHQQHVNAESLLLEAVKQVKVSDLEDDILELPEDDPAAASNQ